MLDGGIEAIGEVDELGEFEGEFDGEFEGVFEGDGSDVDDSDGISETLDVGEGVFEGEGSDVEDSDGTTDVLDVGEGVFEELWDGGMKLVEAVADGAGVFD